MLPDRTIDRDEDSTPEEEPTISLQQQYQNVNSNKEEEYDEEPMERDEEETTSASQQATSSRQFITHDELLNQQRKMTLYETVEYYLLYSDYRVDQQVKELNAIEQTLMRVQQQESSQENSSSQLRNNENNRSLKSLSVGSSIPKQLKRVRKLKTFMNEYGTVCRDFLSRIKQNHSLGEINIDASLKVVNGRRNNSSTALSNRKDSMADNLVENRLELLHSAFHTKCVHNHLLPFIRKSLLLKAKQNIERDKLYGNVHSTEELLLLYQLKHGNNEKMKLSTEYIQENVDRKLHTFKQEVEQCYQQVISNKQR